MAPFEGARPHAVVNADCQVMSLSGADDLVEDCVWQGFTSIVVTFRGTNLLVHRCSFLTCGTGDLRGSCINALDFAGDVVIDDVEFTSIQSERGTVYVGNNVRHIVSLTNCRFSRCTHKYRGSICAEHWATNALQLLTLNIVRCSILDEATTDGYGPLNGRSTEWYIEECTIMRSSVIPYNDNRAAFLRVAATSTTTHLNITVVRCTINNEQTGGYGHLVYVGGPSGDPSAVFAVYDTSIFWQHPLTNGMASGNYWIGLENIASIIFANSSINYTTENTAETPMIFAPNFQGYNLSFASFGTRYNMRNAVQVSGRFTIEECTLDRKSVV
jgi:hypothetical protein